MKRILFALLFHTIFFTAYSQEAPRKFRFIEKESWRPDSPIFNRYYTTDTTSLISFFFDNQNRINTISSFHAVDKVVPIDDSSVFEYNYKRNGTEVEFYDNYKVKSVKTYYMDIPINTWLYYYPSGQVERIENYPSDSLIYELCPNYDMITHFDVEFVYGASSTRSNLLPHGKWTEFYENGNIKVEKEFSMGLATGEWFWYYENGIKKKSGQFYQKLKKYPCKSDFQTNPMLTEEEWEDLYATHVFFHLQPKHGYWKYWDDKGNLLKVKEFDKGKLVKYIPVIKPRK